MLLTYSIIVSGKVQGVFYRQSTKEKAISLNITGSVMNKKNGDVEIVATGLKEKLDELIDWYHQGPPKAVVKNIIVKELPLQVFERFIIQRF
jgi:acylphosphatase